MQKKLTILWAFAFFVLLVGWAITPVQAHHCKGGHFDPDICPDPPGGDDGGGKVVAEYSVDITGAVVGVSVDPWVDQSAHGIGFSDPHGLAGVFTDLSFFEEHFNKLQGGK